MDARDAFGLRRIAVVGDYVPRQCGIATFTSDLSESLAAAFPKLHVFAVPVTDTEEGYDYPPRVRFEIAEEDLTSYVRAADFLNMNGVDVVSVQHEYGIYGGVAGSHLLALLRELRMPVVTTLHTVLRSPDSNQRKVLEEIAKLSDRLVVMGRRAADFLTEIYGVPREKIARIPHGIPDVPFVDPNFYKDQFGVEGKLVLLTFGLLSPGKGIEFVIEALPEILERYPNLIYVVLGATHPKVAREEGESYRLFLERLAAERGVAANVLFHNRFVSTEELVEAIGAADLYVTPYLNREQTCSGTLAYTVGAGKAVISTPYWYAEELLEDGRGVLVPFRDPGAIARAVLHLLDNEAERHAIRKRAYRFGREMIWPEVARRYAEVLARAREERGRRPRRFVGKTLDQRPAELPPLRLDHLRRLTDSTGILQHAVHTVPNYSTGYTTDDNARALLLTVLLEETGSDKGDETRGLPSRYLAFLVHAFDRKTGRFRNELGYDRRFQDDVGPEDAHGRALWALGAVAGRSSNRGRRAAAGQLLDAALPAALRFTSPRAWAFSLLGLRDYLRRFGGDRAARHAQEELAERLLGLWQETASQDWPWFENVVSYANATLPHALIATAAETGCQRSLEAGLAALDWLLSIQKAPEGHFVPIGSNGFYVRGGERARFDQQPIEAHATVSACLEAYRITGQQRFQQEARRAFDWFLGRNDLGLPLYDANTGGCRDGLHPDRANQNEGAESTLAFLTALLELRAAAHVLQPSAEELAAREPA